MNAIAYKICLALTVIGLIYIRADRSTAANDLLGKNVLLMLVLQVFTKKNNALGKCLCLLIRNTVRQHDLNSPISTLHSYLSGGTGACR